MTDRELFELAERVRRGVALVDRPAYDSLVRHVETVRLAIKRAITAACSCGGRGPEDDPCEACELWHLLRPLLQKGET